MKNEITQTSQNQLQNSFLWPEQAKGFRKVLTPMVDILESEEGIELLADMPGVLPSQVEVTLEKETLKIGGTIDFNLPEQGKPLYLEINTKRYERYFTLSKELDSQNLKASMNSGVLHIFIPKTESLKPRQIPVQFHS